MAGRSGHCGGAARGGSGLFETRAIQVFPSATFGQSNAKSSRDRLINGMLAEFLAPELEQVTGLLDRDGFPPRPPSVVFGQHEMIDIDLVPILGQRLAVGAGVCRDRFVVLCWPEAFADFPFSAVGLGLG